ncbi:hypothetical protein [Flavobacterium sp. DG2-3]|uniref:hypothetical protein n=1 Tax=Flavobacterium sp. DG2-3 TaxID=3068317 RepID=UPI00273D6900|nr:hypothetical protein [Flavobacterium sp. DG2-3]MDP5199787.1 hypothetical protein [Flavobacterium sp. DG2-3]
MTVNSYRLPAQIYKYICLNQGRLVPFEELCIILFLSGGGEPFSTENPVAEKVQHTRIMNALLFLSDINLIILDQATDSSTLNLTIRN